MSFDEAEDPVLRQLRQLPVHEPDASRRERVRARCLAALARRRKGERRRLALEPALLAGFSASYLLAILRDVLQLHGIR